MIANIFKKANVLQDNVFLSETLHLTPRRCLVLVWHKVVCCKLLAIFSLPLLRFEITCDLNTKI